MKPRQPAARRTIRSGVLISRKVPNPADPSGLEDVVIGWTCRPLPTSCRGFFAIGAAIDDVGAGPLNGRAPGETQ